MKAMAWISLAQGSHSREWKAHLLLRCTASIRNGATGRTERVGGRAALVLGESISLRAVSERTWGLHRSSMVRGVLSKGTVGVGVRSFRYPSRTSSSGLSRASAIQLVKRAASAPSTSRWS